MFVQETQHTHIYQFTVGYTSEHINLMQFVDVLTGHMCKHKLVIEAVISG